MTVEISVIVLTVWKGVTHWRIRGSRLMNVLYRDGIVFFVGLLLMSLANFTMYLSSHTGFAKVSLSELQRVLHAILTARIILHLRAAAAGDPLNPTLPSTVQDNVVTLADLDFQGTLSTFKAATDSVDSQGGSSRWTGSMSS